MKNSKGAGRPTAAEYAKKHACPKCGFVKPQAQPASRKGKYRGVSYDAKRDRYHARISVGGVTQDLGYFENRIKAAQAYDQAAKTILGRSAILNFPEGV